VGKRLRPLDEEEVKKKMDSIREVGLLTSITVTLYGFMGKPPRNQYMLRAGAYRLEACRRLGWTKIPAIVALLAGPRAELVEVDENLMQTGLTPAERAIFTARRKELYLKIHPETAKGKAQGEGKKRSIGEQQGTDCKVCSEMPDTDEAQAKQPSFVEATSIDTGRSERSIALDAERAEKIADDVMQATKGTSLDSSRYLDQLKGLSHRDEHIQLKQWQADAEKPKSSRRKSSSKGGSSKTPQAAKKGTPEEKHASDLLRLNKAWNPTLDIWNEASPAARKDFVRRLADDLDAEIRFAGETFAPSRPSLNGGDAKPDHEATVH
jgi:ParB-like chromosome segregation protein Spo0J